MTQATKPLRTCRVCGLQALTEDDLVQFAYNLPSAHGRQNICKKCLQEDSKKRSRRTATDDPPGSTRCSVCGRLLTVAESVARGIGPVCWAKGG